MKLRTRLVISFCIIIFVPIIMAAIGLYAINTILPTLNIQWSSTSYEYIAHLPDFKNLVVDVMISVILILFFTAAILVIWTYSGIISRLRTDRIIKDNILWSYIYAQDMGMNVDKRIKQYNDVQKMTLQDVIGFQKKWMKDRTYTYCILGDKKELDMEALKTIAPIEELTQEEIFGY